MIRLLIADYLKEPSDVRLKILLANLNPEFKLTKRNSEQIKLMLADYNSTQDAKRLKIFKSFVSAKIPTLRKPKKNKEEEETEFASNPSPSPSQASSDYTRINEDYKLVCDKYAAEKDARTKESLLRDMKHIENQMDLIIRRIDKQVVTQDSEKDIILRLFGDPDKPSTIAYKLINGVPELHIKSVYDPRVMIKKLFFFANVPEIEYSSGLIDGQSNTWVIRRGSHSNFNQGQTSIGG